MSQRMLFSQSYKHAKLALKPKQLFDLAIEEMKKELGSHIAKSASIVIPKKCRDDKSQVLLKEYEGLGLLEQSNDSKIAHVFITHDEGQELKKTAHVIYYPGVDTDKPNKPEDGSMSSDIPLRQIYNAVNHVLADEFADCNTIKTHITVGTYKKIILGENHYVAVTDGVAHINERDVSALTVINPKGKGTNPSMTYLKKVIGEDKLNPVPFPANIQEKLDKKSCGYMSVAIHTKTTKLKHGVHANNLERTMHAIRTHAVSLISRENRIENQRIANLPKPSNKRKKEAEDEFTDVGGGTITIDLQDNKPSKPSRIVKRSEVNTNIKILNNITDTMAKEMLDSLRSNILKKTNWEIRGLFSGKKWEMHDGDRRVVATKEVPTPIFEILNQIEVSAPGGRNSYIQSLRNIKKILVNHNSRSNAEFYKNALGEFYKQELVSLNIDPIASLRNIENIIFEKKWHLRGGGDTVAIIDDNGQRTGAEKDVPEHVVHILREMKKISIKNNQYTEEECLTALGNILAITERAAAHDHLLRSKDTQTFYEEITSYLIKKNDKKISNLLDGSESSNRLGK